MQTQLGYIPQRGWEVPLAPSTHSESSVQESLASQHPRVLNRSQDNQICRLLRHTGVSISLLESASVLTIAQYIQLACKAFCLTWPGVYSPSDRCYGSVTHYTLHL